MKNTPESDSKLFKGKQILTITPLGVSNRVLEIIRNRMILCSSQQIVYPMTISWMSCRRQQTIQLKGG